MYAGSDHKLRRVDIDSGKTDELESSNAGNIGGAQFSPDGAFISYSKPDDLLRQHVWVKELANGQEHQIGGGDFLASSGAKWTADGKKLLFLGGVSVASIASTTGRGSSQLYAVSLVRWIKIQTQPISIPKRKRKRPTAPEPAAAAAGERGCWSRPERSGENRLGWAGPARHAAHAHARIGEQRSAGAG